MTKTDRASVEQLLHSLECAGHSPRIGAIPTLRALLTRAEQAEKQVDDENARWEACYNKERDRANAAEAKLADTWDEAIEAAADEADTYMEPHVEHAIRAIPNPYKESKNVPESD